MQVRSVSPEKVCDPRVRRKVSLEARNQIGGFLKAATDAFNGLETLPQVF